MFIRVIKQCFLKKEDIDKRETIRKFTFRDWQLNYIILRLIKNNRYIHYTLTLSLTSFRTLALRNGPYKKPLWPGTWLKHFFSITRKQRNFVGYLPFTLCRKLFNLIYIYIQWFTIVRYTICSWAKVTSTDKEIQYTLNSCQPRWSWLLPSPWYIRLASVTLLSFITTLFSSCYLPGTSFTRIIRWLGCTNSKGIFLILGTRCLGRIKALA